MLSYLLEASILERFCAPLCERIHRKEIDGRNERPALGADRFIRHLIEANLFCIALDDNGYWHRFHHLFQDFLKEMLHKKSTPDRIADLDRIAGDWFAENDLIEEAIGHLMAAGDTSAAIQLVVDRRYVLMNDSRYVRLTRWLSFLPEKQVAQNPLLTSTRDFLASSLGN